MSELTIQPYKKLKPKCESSITVIINNCPVIKYTKWNRGDVALPYLFLV